jgi:hypothetical protein
VVKALKVALIKNQISSNNQHNLNTQTKNLAAKWPILEMVKTAIPSPERNERHSILWSSTLQKNR